MTIANKIILGLLFFNVLYAENLALFARVVNIDKDDRLNVRFKSNYKSKKVGAIPLNAYVGVEKCKNNKKTVWCHIYPLVQNWYDKFGFKNKGWVNAKYLKFENRGYVIIKGIRNCAYAIGCHNGKCEVVDNFKNANIEDYDKVGLNSIFIERAYLKGESNFGATPNNVDGFCNTGIFIDNYLKMSRNKI